MSSETTDCTHEDERGSTVMQANGDRYECIVCGTRFRLVPVLQASKAPDSREGGEAGLEVAEKKYIAAVQSADRKPQSWRARAGIEPFDD